MNRDRLGFLGHGLLGDGADGDQGLALGDVSHAIGRPDDETVGCTGGEICCLEQALPDPVGIGGEEFEGIFVVF